MQRYLEIKKDVLISEAYGYLANGKITSRYFNEVLDALDKEYAELYLREKRLWEKYRRGILSDGNVFDSKHRGNREKIKEIRELLKQDCGVTMLSIDLGVMEAFGTPRVEIFVKYAGEEQKRIYQGGVKPNFVSLDFGGCYNIQFIMEDKPVEYVLFSAYGEGATYPMHFRYTQNGKKYVVSSVEVISGNVQNAENMLSNDSRFASMGYDDGLSHFCDHTLSREKSCILLKFQAL